MRSVNIHAETQRRLREYETPTWGYRFRTDFNEWEKDVFDGVLPPGWQDSPVDRVMPSGGPDFDAMDVDALVDFAAAELGMKLDRRWNRDNLAMQAAEAWGAREQ